MLLSHMMHLNLLLGQKFTMPKIVFPCMDILYILPLLWPPLFNASTLMTIAMFIDFCDCHVLRHSLFTSILLNNTSMVESMPIWLGDMYLMKLVDVNLFSNHNCCILNIFLLYVCSYILNLVIYLFLFIPTAN